MKWIRHLCASLMQNVRGTRKQFHKRLRIDSNNFFSCRVVDCCSKLSFELFGRSIGVNYRLKRTVCWCQHNNTSYLGGVVSPTDSMDYVNDAELTMISISRLGRSLSLGWCCSCESCVFRRQTDGMHTQHTIHYMPYSVNKQVSGRASQPSNQPAPKNTQSQLKQHHRYPHTEGCMCVFYVRRFGSAECARCRKKSLHGICVRTGTEQHLLCSFTNATSRCRCHFPLSRFRCCYQQRPYVWLQMPKHSRSVCYHAHWIQLG